MAVTDTIIRRGGTGKQVLVGPQYLHGPTSDRRWRVGCDVDRITGDVDFYAVNTTVCDQTVPTPPGDYTVIIEPFLEKGFRRPIKAIKWVALIKVADGQAPELLFRKHVEASDRKFTTKTVNVGPNERLFLSIQRAGGISSIQYKLSLDATVTRAEVKKSRAKSKPAVSSKPMVEKTDADKAWDLVQSGADED